MLDPELVKVAVIFLAALSVGGIAYVLIMPFVSGERTTEKRVASVAGGRKQAGARSIAEAATATRKTQVEDVLKELEAKQKSKKKVTLAMRLRRAGLNIPNRSFYIASFVLGAAIGGATYFSGSSPFVSGLAFFAGAVGLPRWIIWRLALRRQNRFLIEFANAIDVIVRGVKTGLPLNDCLRIISEEAEEPVRGEFVEVVEQQSVGVPLGKAFDRMYERMPLQEVNFFAIVVAIQQQTGGNLAEALDNLSQVLRGRQRLHGKVKAFSAEAKASAMIIGSLPLIVMGALSVMNPQYVMLLWTEELGKIMLMCSAVWMLIGVLIMRKMINFDY
ncbi:MAG: type II secretion system F family protein [Hyphomicrobiaceae bacterium]|nr:type II secretion system F family protein [Hyphomicrobiaceae bacterium]